MPSAVSAADDEMVATRQLSGLTLRLIDPDQTLNIRIQTLEWTMCGGGRQGYAHDRRDTEYLHGQFT